MKTKRFFKVVTLAATLGLIGSWQLNAQQVPSHMDRFRQLYDDIHNPANGYFSPEGAPYHSVETMIVEAPDQGHESTSELYSYWIWLEAMYGKIEGDWTPLKKAWATMEDQIIPTHDDQPTNNYYTPHKPSNVAPEFPEPTFYPAPFNQSPAGQDPISNELQQAYGTWDVYGMHWLLDCDNFYGYGRRGDGVGRPSYINTFQRGEQESTWETVPHPSWEDFQWGNQNGFLPIFIGGDYAKQWRYTNAPDADGRAVQAMYWAKKWAQEQGVDISTLPIDEAAKMGDYLRLSFFDKHFKPIGAQDINAQGATGYGSCHYLMSWYYAWGGNIPEPNQSWGWAWRIGCSHVHFGYQNPFAAYVLSNDPDFRPKSTNGARDWEDSFNRQMELYQYLQSPKGAIAGGITNSWNGQYEKYPAGKSTFYDMAYDDNPVYHDPGSNTWPGFQGWSMERIAELYYEFNNRDAKALMDKWANWAISEIQLKDDGTFAIPARFEWSGEPDEWNPANPGNNSNLDVVVTDYGTDLGVTASFARTLIYYAAATQEHDGAMHQGSADVAKELLDRMWVLYRDDIGLAAPEKRGDYKRFNDEVYIPESYNGVMANGAQIKNGVTFTDLRPNYKQDENWNKLQAALAAGEDFEISYHRGWAQMEIALANAEYALLIGDGPTAPQVKITAPKNGANFNSGTTIVVTADATDRDGTVESVEFFANGTSIGIDYQEPWSVNYVNAPDSPAIDITAEATDNDGLTGTSRPGAVVISIGNAAPVAIISAHASEVKKGMEICFDASESYDINNDPLTYTWDIEGFTYTSVAPCHTFSQGPKTVTIELTVSDGQASSTVTSQIQVTDKPDCFFGLPSAAPLATTGYAPYSHINVYSKNAPQILENVTQFVINWDLQNNGLWQFSMLTNNGQPTWWMDLRSVTTYKFNQPNPELTISGSGFPGLDGSYYVGKVDGDFIMVEKSGAYTIQFTNNPTPVDCNPSKAATELSISGLTTPLAYPNPATDVLFIRDLQDTKQIEILNSIGQLVDLYSNDYDNLMSINVADMDAGMYHIRYTLTNGEIENGYFIKR